MSKRAFSANSWLREHSLPPPGFKGKAFPQKNPPQDSYNPPFSLHSEDFPPLPETFNPHRYFIPGWSGHSLFSRSAIAIKKLQEGLWKDALQTFKRSSGLPKTLASSIHREFLHTIEDSSSFSPNDIRSLENGPFFWSQVRDELSPFRDPLDHFIELYCFRVATVYLLKLKFLISYSEAIHFAYNRDHIVNPSTFINKLFKKGSSQEMSCESLKVNHYSWYRPSPHCAKKISTLTENFSKITTTQLMKICSFRKLNPLRAELKFDDQNYSHALSHQSYGHFINQLLLYFPRWKKGDSYNFSSPKESKKVPQIYNTKFLGDHIESLGHGHWLSQEAPFLKERELVCPDFSSYEKSSELFVRIAQELQFLNFLVRYSQDHRIDTRQFVIKVTREKYHRTKQGQSQQINLFPSREQQTDLIYDRIVLNLEKLPKKNPHHFLITQIQNQKDILAPQAILLVMTNQKLFVPSQNKKVKALLKNFKLDAIFNFEKLKGRGEIPSYIYILRRRTSPSPFNSDLSPHFLNHSEAPNLKQESCLSFNWTGELTIFSKFERIVEELHRFFKERSHSGTSIYQKTIERKLSFECLKEAIIEGQLLNSLSNKDNITHPQFFKNLTKSCSPFDRFFSFQELQEKANRPQTSDFLGIIQTSELSRYSSILIVDLRDSLRPQLEIISPESYLAKKEDYGSVYFQYYGLLPKICNINLNLMREYLATDLGKQVIQICLSGGPTKMKGKLKSLLLPNFFLEGVNMGHLSPEEFLFFSLSPQDILNYHPKELKELISKELSRMESFKSSKPWLYLSLLAHLKLNLKSSLENFSDESTKEINFTNPLFIEALTSLDTHGIYPSEEIFTEFLIVHKNELDAPLDAMNFSKKEENYTLEFISQEKVLIKLHAPKETLLFIQFILSKGMGLSILHILQNLEVPSYNELKNVLTQFELIIVSLKELYSRIQEELKKRINEHIAQA